MPTPPPDLAPELTLAAGFAPASRQMWMRLVEKALAGADFDKRMMTPTVEGCRIEPLYTRADTISGADTMRPGEAPFTRGLRAGTTGSGWDKRVVCFQSDPALANAQLLEDLEGGATSVALAIEAGGHGGLPNTKAALAKALDNVLLDICPVALVAFEGTPAASANLIALWQERGIALADRAGAFGADPLGTLAMFGELPVPLDQALGEAAALVPLALPMPHVTALHADGVLYHNAGASAAEELACLLATLVAYLRAAEAAGVEPAAALPKIGIRLGLDADQFLGLAKLRTARRLVARVAQACGAGASLTDVTLTAVTSGRMLAKRDPWTNILRNTIACAAAAQGGADTIVVLPHSMPLGCPDRLARRLSRNIQIVAEQESHLGRVTDPAGGSWYVEQLTAELAEKAWALFQEIEGQASHGERGMAAALASGFIQDRISATAAQRAEAIATGRQPLTGVSAFPRLGDDGAALTPWPAPAPKRAAKVTVKALAMVRLSEPFERLRDIADAMAAKTGRAPTVFLASLGDVIDHNVRSTWAQNTLASGGIASLTSEGYASTAEVVAAFKASGATAACLCSSDKIYAQKAEATTRALKVAGAKLILMAGRPGDLRPALLAAGVDEFLSSGGDTVKTLAGLLGKLGVGA